jgi:hypothetical protein
MANINKVVNVELKHMDWEMLSGQKLIILELISRSNDLTKAEDDTLNGIIHFLDEVQDQAAEQIPHDDVFFSPEKQSLLAEKIRAEHK